VPRWREEEITALLAEVGTHGLGGINPDAGQLRALLDGDEGGPVQFVNLLAYRAQASYPVGHELAGAGLSGAEAYARYGAVALDHLVRRGGTLLLYNDILGLFVGRSEPWDQVVAVQYPGADAFVDMLRDPDYRAALVHREAGLAEAVVLMSRSLLGA
jgi:uncharacterized protein (DUF1330 family)